MTGQSRFMSFVESWANVVVGILVSFITNLTVLPLFGFTPSWGQLAGITAVFTAVSVIRSYILRRVFEGFTRRRTNPLPLETSPNVSKEQEPLR